MWRVIDASCCCLATRSSGLYWRPFNPPQPAVEFGESQVTLRAMTFLAISNLLLQRRQQVEGDICRLEISRIGVGEVVRQRAKSAGSRRRDRFASPHQRGCVDS